jgi:Mn2+/Fe2+ NRAMP family transporter
MYVSQVINGIVLPVVLIFILLLVNDRNLMQNHTNGPVFNAVAWLTTVVMIALSLVLLVGTLQA